MFSDGFVAGPTLIREAILQIHEERIDRKLFAGQIKKNNLPRQEEISSVALPRIHAVEDRLPIFDQLLASQTPKRIPHLIFTETYPAGDPFQRRPARFVSPTLTVPKENKNCYVHIIQIAEQYSFYESIHR